MKEKTNTLKRVNMDERTLSLVMIALNAAILCVLAPLSIPLPFSPVPISLTNLALYFMVYVAGTKRSTAAFIVYVLLGAAGLPVFSNYTGGAGKLAGPTGGYILGFLPMILFMGLFVHKHMKNKILCIFVMMVATCIVYTLGTAWLSYSAHLSVTAALWAGVIPFIPGDLFKIVLAAILGPVLHGRLKQAGVLK